MVVYRTAALLGLLFFLEMHFSLTVSATDCPLDLSGSNFTLAASICSNDEDRGTCCRYLNALIAVSIARYANLTGDLGVSSDLSQICLGSISESLELYGVTTNATAFCGFGTKIPVNYECQGRTTVTQMLESPKFANVTANCELPLSAETDCRTCLNAGILYLRNLIGAVDNMTLSTCRDATFVALASQVDNGSAVDIASCFFGVQGLMTPSDQTPSLSSPQASPSPLVASSPSQVSLTVPLKQKHHVYHLTLIPGLGIAVTAVAVMMLVVLIFLIQRKSRELENSDAIDKASSKAFSQLPRRFQGGPTSMFRKFTHKEMKKATDNFNTVIGQGGFGTVFKAQFSDGSVVAVKRMDKVSEQAEDEFCREIELLARLHHRHLVALRGFCVARHERFLVYEFMANGSLKDHLHNPGRTPLNWQNRIQIAIDVANALEYLHFYCDPPLCHRDIKSSNILLDENFVAKVKYNVRYPWGIFNEMSWQLSGYMDPEYVVTQELTEKSDVYSYGVVLLELLTARRAIQDNKNLVEWSQVFMNSDSRLPELVDPTIADSFDFDQLQTFVTIIRWCIQREGRARPSIKQVLRLLYECSDPMHSGFVEAVEEGEYEGTEAKGRTSRGKMRGGELIFHSGDGRATLREIHGPIRKAQDHSPLVNSGQIQTHKQVQISSIRGLLTTTKVLIPIGFGTEEMEAVIMIDVLRRAGADVTVASVDPQLEIKASGGTKLVADASISACWNETYDLVALPGGMPGSVTLRDCEVLRKITSKQAEEKRLYGAISAAPAVTLLPWGLLRRKEMTGHPQFMGKLPTLWKVESKIQVSDELTTSRGPGTCFEFAISLVEQLFGESVAVEVAKLLLMGATKEDSRKEEFNGVEWTVGHTPHVLIPVANGSEAAEIVMIADILRRAKVDVVIASVEKSVKILASQGTKIVADKLIGKAAESIYDLIILPGGIVGTERLHKSRVLKKLLKEQESSDRIYGAICSSSEILHRQGLLKGKRAMDSARVVIDGKVITSRGLSTTTEMALGIVSKLFGHTRAWSVAESLVFEYPRELKD
ncbi:hypothetical protein RHGRI_032659 [Rhododendron griersonianum]|uniref:Protein kinase domain-containing protein n=1 Tax=Rhododendron griersonianum TaxID=479676 RepID=A0AAV6IF53_9ERIC|nr:hypothetical protein RHGRI_032659 [Rhododendron griersonianum]